MKDPKDGTKMVDVALSRIVIREGSEQQYIFLQEDRRRPRLPHRDRHRRSV